MSQIEPNLKERQQPSTENSPVGTIVSIKPIYKVDDIPPTWWECLLYGWQHTLVDISPFILPLGVASALSMSDSQSAQFINFCLVAMGIATLIQTTIGNRLPIIQGPSANLIATIVPIAKIVGAASMWLGILIGALCEMLLGGFRIVGYIRKLFPMVVSGVVIICIGISLAKVAATLMLHQGRTVDFSLAGLTILSVFTLQTVGRDLWGGIAARGAIFFSIWLIGLGVASIVGEVNWGIVAPKPWFAFPSIFPYGTPISWWKIAEGSIWVATFTIFIGYVGSIVESIGDYAATCAVSDEKYQVKHMNKGIFAEGLGSTIACVLGGLPCTSYTQNIGIIATTRVASRFVVQIAAVFLLLYGLCPKFGALLVAIPRPVLGAVFVIVCGMIVVSGIELLQSIPKNTNNSLIIGTTLVCAIGIPQYVTAQTWFKEIPLYIQSILSNTVVISVILGIVLNLIFNILLQDKKSSERKN